MHRWQILLLLLARFFFLSSFPGCSSFDSFVRDSFLVYFLFSFDLFPDTIFVSLSLIFSSSLLLARWHVSASHRRAESMLRALNFFFSPALLHSMPLILFKLQSPPAPLFSISFYIISLTKSPLFPQPSIPSRLYLPSDLVSPYYVDFTLWISPIFAAQSVLWTTADAATVRTIRQSGHLLPLSFSLIIAEFYRGKSSPFAQILSIFVSSLLISPSLPPRVTAFCIARYQLSSHVPRSIYINQSKHDRGRRVDNYPRIRLRIFQIFPNKLIDEIIQKEGEISEPSDRHLVKGKNEGEVFFPSSNLLINPTDFQSNGEQQNPVRDLLSSSYRFNDHRKRDKKKSIHPFQRSITLLRSIPLRLILGQRQCENSVILK